jgi:hypothetical protein
MPDFAERNGDRPSGTCLQIVNLTQSSCGFADGSAAVSVSSGQAPYQFSWSHSGAVSGNTAAGLAAGNYSVTVTDANNCTDVISFNISDTQGRKPTSRKLPTRYARPTTVP